MHCIYLYMFKIVLYSAFALSRHRVNALKIIMVSWKDWIIGSKQVHLQSLSLFYQLFGSWIYYLISHSLSLFIY